MIKKRTFFAPLYFALSVSVILSGLPRTTQAQTPSYDPLEVRFYNNTGNGDDNVQLLVTGTDPTDAAQFNVYTSNGIATSVPNGTSVSLTNLTPVTDSTGTYRRLYVQYTKSGSFWVGLTNQQYSTGANKGGNPSPVGPSTNQWGMAPFVQVEYAYFGSGFDTVDVTAINELSVPTYAVVRSNTTSPVILQGPAGATNGAILPTVLTNLRMTPGVNWFGSATNNNTLRLVGPSSAAAPGLMMPMGAYLGPGASGTVNFLQGWPGFSAPSLSRYVSQVAYNTTNNANAPDGTPWGMTKIHAEVGDPVPGGYFFVWNADLTFQPNTNAQAVSSYANTNYVTPVPVLTNVSVGVYSNYGAYTSGATPITNFPASLGWTIQYTPDSGNPQNAVFSGYIYSAPASFIGSSNQGYVSFWSGGAANNWITNVAALGSEHFYPSVLDRFLNEIAFGFAGGFVQSPVNGWTNGWQYNSDGKITNNSNSGSPNVLIGRMNSTQWWDQTNGLYRANRTNDDGCYSAWGNQIFLLSPTLYSHPISDRMLYAAYTPGVPLYQAHSSTNVWLEIHLTNAVSAPPAGASRPGISSVSFNTNLPVGLVYSNQGGNLVVMTNTNAGGQIVPTNQLPFGFVPTANGSGTSPAFWQNNMIVLTNTSTPQSGGGLTNVPIPEITITTTNTNGGGVWLSALPYGVIATTNQDGTLTLSGHLIPQSYVAPAAGGAVSVVNYSGMGPNGAAPIASIGVMTYGTNNTGELDVTVNEIPIFVNGTQPGPTVLGFDPVAGGPGTKVKILGANFVKPQAEGPALQNFNAVYFSSSVYNSPVGYWVEAQYTWPYTNNLGQVDSNALAAVVPSGASTGAILVAVTNGEGILSGVGSTDVFTVLPAPAGFWQVPQGGGGYNFSGIGLGHLFTTNANWQDLDTMQLTVLNWQQSMTDPAVGSSGYYSTNLPRGLHLINRWVTTNNTPGVVSNSWQGYIVGRMVDQCPLLMSSTFTKVYAQTSSITAYNFVGQTNDTNFVLELVVSGKNAPYPNSSTNTNAPVPYGTTTFNATNALYFSNALYYSNTPSYWEATGLPAGLALSVDLNPEGTDVQASIVGTPTNGSGTMTATVYAVNVLSSNSPYNSMPATNINTITFNFGATPSSYLTYSNWVGAWALSGSNTNTTADPDGDGYDNYDEYAFGGNPTNPTPYLINISGSNISYVGLTNAGTNYSVQNTTNLSTGPWTNYSATVTNATNQLNIPLPAYYHRKEFTVPITPGTNNFYRVTFTNQ
ncbi:MAG: hypothetical protein FGM15_00140 [Chthoniobacterales bacterium]|nr:hypothetical protein [Chthoniobacterales bacterium]